MSFLCVPIQRISVVSLFVLVFPLIGCKPRKLEHIKAVKQEKVDFDNKEAAAAMELAGLNSELSVLGKDSQAVEASVEKLRQRKLLLEKEDMRLDKLLESISGQTSTLEKEHQNYRTIYQPKPL